jgi:hypothetical protein
VLGEGKAVNHEWRPMKRLNRKTLFHLLPIREQEPDKHSIGERPSRLGGVTDSSSTSLSHLSFFL